MKLFDIINNLYILFYILVVVIFGIFLVKVLYNWIFEDVDDVIFFFKRFFEVREGF